ncbi:MAG TPA: hypothetical protein VMR28_02170 [Candidatus Saccharimonadales bacterium]|nr:hypothetical protein [Candidatus Saccharimonadales bacterium]
MDSLNDILFKKDFDEPAEITAIKSYVERQYKTRVGVQLQQNSIIIVAKSAALANTLRLKTPQLQEAAATTKKLIFRIGS